MQIRIWRRKLSNRWCIVALIANWMLSWYNFIAQIFSVNLALYLVYVWGFEWVIFLHGKVFIVSPELRSSERDYVITHWATPSELHTPPVEDFRNMQHRGSVNSKLISLIGTSKWNIYSLCDRSDLKVIQKLDAFANLHSPCGTLSQNLPQGVYGF